MLWKRVGSPATAKWCDRVSGPLQNLNFFSPELTTSGCFLKIWLVILVLDTSVFTPTFSSIKLEDLIWWSWRFSLAQDLHLLPDHHILPNFRPPFMNLIHPSTQLKCHSQWGHQRWTSLNPSAILFFPFERSHHICNYFIHLFIQAVFTEGRSTLLEAWV